MLIKWDKEIRKRIIRDIQDYYYRNNEEEIGEIAAGDILEFIDSHIGKYYYNEGVEQAKKLWENSAARLEEDLFSLKRPID